MDQVLMAIIGVMCTLMLGCIWGICYYFYGKKKYGPNF